MFIIIKMDTTTDEYKEKNMDGFKNKRFKFDTIHITPILYKSNNIECVVHKTKDICSYYFCNGVKKNFNKAKLSDYVN